MDTPKDPGEYTLTIDADGKPTLTRPTDHAVWHDGTWAPPGTPRPHLVEVLVTAADAGEARAIVDEALREMKPGTRKRDQITSS